MVIIKPGTEDWYRIKRNAYIKVKFAISGAYCLMVLALAQEKEGREQEDS